MSLWVQGSSSNPSASPAIKQSWIARPVPSNWSRSVDSSHLEASRKIVDDYPTSRSSYHSPFADFESFTQRLRDAHNVPPFGVSADRPVG